jgi:hypothetical protein
MTTIGVTGHRVLADTEEIAAGVEEALRGIQEAFPGETLTVVSPLAEGADRLVTRRVLLRPGARLVVPLPLDKGDYMAGFQSDESRREFRRLLHRAAQVIALPSASTHDEAYAAAGRYVLDHCDVLIAIWDGRNPQGRGGTAEVVAQARRRALPLAWVRARGCRPGAQKPKTTKEEEGKVSFERFPQYRSVPQDPQGQS